LEALNIYGERDICDHVRRVGNLFQAGLRDLIGNPIVGEVRGLGLMGAIELVADRKERQHFAPEIRAGDCVVSEAEACGLFVRAVGDSVVLAPPLVISEGEVAELLRRFRNAVEAASAKLLDSVSIPAR
jgi:4-aminobutyrate--pyruvate transaminase